MVKLGDYLDILYMGRGFANPPPGTEGWRAPEQEDDALWRKVLGQGRAGVVDVYQLGLLLATLVSGTPVSSREELRRAIEGIPWPGVRKLAEEMTSEDPLRRPSIYNVENKLIEIINMNII